MNKAELCNICNILFQFSLSACKTWIINYTERVFYYNYYSNIIHAIEIYYVQSVLKDVRTILIDIPL